MAKQNKKQYRHKKTREERQFEKMFKRKFSLLMQKRLVLLFIFIVLAFAILAGRITYINAESGSQYTKKVLDQQSYNSRTIPYKRGDIVDTNGTVLATSERVYNVILDIEYLLSTPEEDGELEKAIDDTTEVLVELFGVEESVVENALEDSPTSRYKILKKNVDYNTRQTFEEYEEVKSMSERERDALESDVPYYPDLKGIWLEESYIRSYPYNTMASSLIGLASSANYGLGGIEEEYSSVLNGVNGRKYGYFDGDITQVTVKEAENGDTVMLTIDQTLQSIVEKHIKIFDDANKDNVTWRDREGNESEEEGSIEIDGLGSKTTAVLMLDPNTGAILASSHYPNIDLNNPGDLTKYYSLEEIQSLDEEKTSEALNELRTNFVVTDTYEPGSTVKSFTVAMALEEGVIDENDTYQCSGSLEVGGHTIHCANRNGHGTITLEESIAYSCNVAMMKIAAELGPETFTGYQSFYGFGDKTDVDLPNETSAASLLYSAEDMMAADLATNSFGQNFNVTMLQVASATAALLNGGNFYEPYVVKQIQDTNGSVIETTEPTLKKKIVTEETSDTMSDYFRATIDYGTAKSVQIEGYDIGGKTGTAEKLPRGNGKYLVSFIGAVPMDHPEVLIYVVVDEPNVDNQANSKLAQDIAVGILQEALPYLGVEKTEVETIVEE